ncbi:HAMP domain-containing histidine kinase [Sinomicrobium sp. FJxs]|uniref:histidine kinase n=2 Tax=Sinomicrobium weinanense TaxID=2842200 RepID=A0A926JPW0_9FLAO|nr:HAMP domain-containing histidine kinase [Sinomicrobium weinanense]MBU3121958.1 HAMP domain-containing histidine kinase [Sinomicrobium weinanense]
MFAVSVVGLGLVQYQYLQVGLSLARAQFNDKIGRAVKQIKTDLNHENELTFLMGKALTDDDTYFTLSLDSLRDASSHYYRDFLQDRLLMQGIKTDFTYVIYSKDSVLSLRSPDYRENRKDRLRYPIELTGYLPELTGKRMVTELQFRDLNAYFLSQLNGLTIPGLIFIIVIIIAVIWVLRSLYRQHSIITTTNDFINNLTHELKTPVFSIGLATKMLMEREKEAGSTRFLHIIKQQNERLKQHIDKVLQLATLEKKKKYIRMEETDFYPHLKKFAEDFREMTVLEQVDFRYKLHGDHYPVRGEVIHILNAVGNLLDNAKKYSENVPKVTLEAHTEREKLYISVTDNGIGIPEKEREQVFEKFFRGGTGDIHRVEGYGLGLNYVKQVVRSHKGKILVDSEPGKGTKVTIVIPLLP